MRCLADTTHEDLVDTTHEDLVDTTHREEPVSRLEPLSLDEVEGLADVEETYRRTLGFVPNGLRIMARRPRIVQGFIALRRAVLDPSSGTVPAELKNLVAHVASRAHGCLYCQAHSLQGAARAGAERARLEHG